MSSYYKWLDSWEEVLLLSQRFPKLDKDAQPLYGFHDGFGGDDQYLIDRISQSYGLSYLDIDNLKVQYHSAKWEEVYRIATDALRSQSVYTMVKPSTGTDQQSSPYLLFKEGHLTMMLGNYEMFKQLTNYGGAIEWGIVTQPVSPDHRDIGPIQVPYTLTINAKTGQS